MLCQPVQACSGPEALPSLVQPSPAFSSWLQSDQGLGALPSCPEAQGDCPSFRNLPREVQGPGALTVPRDVPRKSTWPYPIPAHRNCAQAEKQCLKTPGKILSWTFYFFYLTFKSKSLVFTFVSQEVSHIGFLLPVSHVCLQIAFPVSHIDFTISLNFDNLIVKWNWGLICGWTTATLCLVWTNIPLFSMDFYGKPEIFLKHLKEKKKKFLKAFVCMIGLWLFFRIA